jgi:adenylate cyclase
MVGLRRAGGTVGALQRIVLLPGAARPPASTVLTQGTAPVTSQAYPTREGNPNAAGDPLPAPVDGTGVPRAQQLIDWLIGEGRFVARLSDLLAGFGEKLVAEGAPVWRMTLHLRLLHPALRGVTYVWRADTGRVEEIGREHGVEQTPLYLKSPMFTIVEQGAAGIRQRLEGVAPPFPYGILDDLKAEGATDYVALPIRFSSGQLNLVSLASNRPGGFATEMLDCLSRLIPIFGLAAETLAVRMLAADLLDTYVGHAAGERILAGTVERGSGASLRAVIWFCDLRGFTALADRLSREETLALLNGYFEAVGDPVMEEGGEILKFIGDAVLAIFPLDNGRSEAEAARAACRAARRATERLAEVNDMRRVEGRPPIDHGIALHIGEVTWGNIGTRRRLDFTVIGPAVNLAARLERMTRQLHRRIVASEAFARACPDGGLEPLGDHAVRDIAEPVAIHAVPEETP